MNILFLAHRAPFPPDRGDRIRAFNVLRYLAPRAKVHLIAFGDEVVPDGLVDSATLIPLRKSRRRAAVEALATGRPISLAAFHDHRFADAVSQCLPRNTIDAIYVFSSQMAQYVPAGFTGRVVMDFVDVDSEKFADYARSARNSRAWLFAREARLLLAHDRAVAARADAALFVSDAEAALFRARGGTGAILTVENGIDTRRFDPAAAFDQVRSPTPLIVFTGQMDYPPNVEAVEWFARDMLPEIHRRHPAAAFAVVGRAPAPAVVGLASIDGVIVTGEVADVRGWIAAAAVVVAPLKLARGIQNKVLEAMAMARPVVASAAAAEGIDHAGTIRVGGDAGGIAAAVADLLDDPAAAGALGIAGRARVEARYAWDARLAPLDGILGLDVTSRRSAA